MRKAFRIVTVASGILYAHMAAGFFSEGPVVMGVLATIVSAWYFFGETIIRKMR